MCKLQTELAQSVLAQAQTGFIERIVTTGLSRGRHLAIYRNNVFSNFREVLRAVYPVVERLVGESFFNYAADRFIRLYPSTSGGLHRFGGDFAEFLASFPPAADLVYLPDTARLEWLGLGSFVIEALRNRLALEHLYQVSALYPLLALILNPRLLSSRAAPTGSR